MKKYVWPVLGVLIIAAIFIIRFGFDGNEDTWICSNGTWIKHGNPSGPMPTSTCAFTPEDLSKKELSKTDVLAAYFNASKYNEEKKNFGNDFFVQNFPKVLGIYNGKTLVHSYYCSDVCPDNGTVNVIYKDVPETECKNLNGEELYTVGWGKHYDGCSPLTSKIGNLVKDGEIWSLVYEEPGKPALKAKLNFEGAVCSGVASCTDFKIGDRVEIKGILSGESLEVWEATIR